MRIDCGRALLLLLTLAASVPAGAQPLGVMDVFGPFSVESNGAGQLSSVVVNRTVITTGGSIEAAYAAAPSHCSNAIMHFLLDGSERAISGELAPGAVSGFVNLGAVPAGVHTVGLQVEGVLGGCNVGSVSTWGGTGAVRFQAASALTVQLDGASYQTGQVMTVLATLLSLTAAMPVDAYIVVQVPGGELLSLQLGGGLVPGLVPIGRNFVPFPFQGQLLQYTFNGSEPPGTYTWYAALTQAGTLNVISALDQHVFTFTP